MAMLGCLLLSLLWTIAYYSWEVHLTLKQLRNQNMTFKTSWFCQSAIYDSQPALFLALGTLLNINKWVYYTLRTRAYKQGMNPSSKHYLKSYKKWLLFITCLLVVCVIAPYFNIIGDACNDSNYQNVFDLIAYYNTVTAKLFLTTEVIFVVLFLMFAITSATMIITLKNSVPLLYK